MSELIMDRLNLYRHRFQVIRFGSDPFACFVAFLNCRASFFHLCSSFFITSCLLNAYDRVVRVANNLRNRLTVCINTILNRLLRLSLDLLCLHGIAYLGRESARARASDEV